MLGLANVPDSNQSDVPGVPMTAPQVPPQEGTVYLPWKQRIPEKFPQPKNLSEDDLRNWNDRRGAEEAFRAHYLNRRLKQY